MTGWYLAFGTHTCDLADTEEGRSTYQDELALRVEVDRKNWFGYDLHVACFLMSFLGLSLARMPGSVPAGTAGTGYTVEGEDCSLAPAKPSRLQTSHCVVAFELVAEARLLDGTC